MGAICAAKIQAEMRDEGISDKIDLPFDPVEKDILCRRDADGTTHFNIYQAFRHHSPTGMEWGYPGSGPADFCLNIVEMFVREMYPELKPEIALWDKSKITRRGWDLHQKFKSSDLFGDLERSGGRIRGQKIRAWITGQVETELRFQLVELLGTAARRRLF
jgi:hypothetical protein